MVIGGYASSASFSWVLQLLYSLKLIESEMENRSRMSSHNVVAAWKLIFRPSSSSMVGAKSFLVEVCLGVVGAKENSEIIFTRSPGNGDCRSGESFSLVGLIIRGCVLSALGWVDMCPPPSGRSS